MQRQSGVPLRQPHANPGVSGAPARSEIGHARDLGRAHCRVGPGMGASNGASREATVKALRALRSFEYMSTGPRSIVLREWPRRRRHAHGLL